MIIYKSQLHLRGNSSVFLGRLMKLNVNSSNGVEIFMQYLMSCCFAVFEVVLNIYYRYPAVTKNSINIFLDLF